LVSTTLAFWPAAGDAAAMMAIKTINGAGPVPRPIRAATPGRAEFQVDPSADFSHDTTDPIGAPSSPWIV
jgi:hypothetical protein